MRILVLGASGMLGNAVFRYFSVSTGFHTYGSIRSNRALNAFPENLRSHLISGVDVENFDNLTRLFSVVRPDVVINCVGLVKQLSEADDPLSVIPINSLLPHRLAKLCDITSSRFVHLSTDCVFSGKKGMYTEDDNPDANDLYGRSKLLGEVNYKNSITLRTSIIGHELIGARSLVGWFLHQEGTVKGYKHAIFSGLPTAEIAKIIRDYVLPRNDLHGLYHVSAEPIDKYNFLRLVAQVYNKNVDIIPDVEIEIDRSLDSSRFQAETGYKPASWPELVSLMREFY